MQVQALGPTIGALVSDIDLALPLADSQRDALLAALLQHHVLLFENQPVTAPQHRDLAARFGSLHIHPIYPQRAEAREIILLDTDLDNPPMGALLSARQLSPPPESPLLST